MSQVLHERVHDLLHGFVCIAATSGLTLGDEAILPGGSWNGRMRPLKVSADGEVSLLSLPPASVALIKIRTR